MAVAEPGRDPRVRDVLLLALGAGGTALCITLIYQAMRAVMDIGGACADGGPYVPVQPCPDGVAISMVLSSLGLFLFGGIATWYGVKVGGVWTAAPLLAWSALFVSLGWNFIEFGIVNPPEGEDMVWGWLIPGVLFIVMGVVPLLLGASVLGSLRGPGGTSGRSGPGRGVTPVVRTFPLGPAPTAPAPSATTVAPVATVARAATVATTGSGARDQELQAIAVDLELAVVDAMARTPADPDARDAGPTGADFDEGTQALLDRLERLADMRDRSLLAEAEYETAKDVVMRELEARS